MDQKVQPRSIALQILMEVNQGGRFANISLKEHLRSYSPTSRDAALISRLVYGTLEKQITIDRILDKLANMKRVKPQIRNILRLGAYQILFLDRVPDSAACNEAVKLCKKHGLFALQGFVNGTLRNLSRGKKALLSPKPHLSIAEKLSFQYSYPVWLAEKWIRDYNPKIAEAIMKPMDTKEGDTGVSIRVSTSKISPETLKEKLLQSGLEVRQGVHMKEALRVKGLGDMEQNSFFQQGKFAIQGESSMLDTYIVDPQPGDMILDACSSPGGKAIHMAERMKGQGKVIAWDIHPHRVDLVKRNSNRMRTDIVHPMTVDAAIADPKWKDAFDRVLIDAPCSGLGIIHKKPDIKLSIKPDDLQQLPALQAQILATCSDYLKPGGVLVYSTCTINPDENQHIIAAFLAQHPNYQLDDLSPYVPSTLNDTIRDGMIQLIPSLHGTDGFFIARMRRRI